MMRRFGAGLLIPKFITLMHIFSRGSFPLSNLFESRRYMREPKKRMFARSDVKGKRIGFALRKEST